ncbi:hypothetical protein GJAV_G00051900 [Gymnothorax javanicus]|nr:hypothetical protein GJAV_G00051900 [Gymnothorax javanicus]
MMLKVLLAALCFSAIQAVILHQDSPDRIPGEYIVVLKPVNEPRASKLRYIANAMNKVHALSDKLSIGRQWDIGTFLGFQLNGDDETLVNYVANLPDVKYVEANAMAYINQCYSDNNAIWNLKRVSGRNSTSDRYSFSTGANTNVAVYILDTGIRISHVDFEGRAYDGANFVSGEGFEDEHGHGTHCAGTAVGKDYGVAKNVAVVNVKVLSRYGFGSYAQIISGVNWAAADNVKARVLSMSLGGRRNMALNEAIDAATGTGALVVVAAGNDNDDACDYSPASAPTAFTVGSTDSSDSRSYFSNWGTCVNNFAPGSAITSAWYTSDTATDTLSGTSMACPHVAGLAARYLAEINDDATPQMVSDWIVRSGTPDTIRDVGPGSPNNFMYANCPL